MKSDNILTGIRVLDVGSWVAAPAAATAMADFGADVIKVEQPGGDPFRNFMGIPGFPVTEDNYPWLLVGRNKRSLVLDLKSDEGYEALCRLIETADVFLTNYPPEVLKRLKVRYSDVAALNDELIYAQLSGYGEEGPDANQAAFDRSAWWARSGMMDLVRSGDSPPAAGAPAWGDYATSTSVFAGIMMALFRRERTGKGSKVSTSLLANGVWSNSMMLQALLCGGKTAYEPPRAQNPMPLGVPYQCQDKRWFYPWIFDVQGQWVYFLTVLGCSSMLDDPRFASAEACHANATATIEHLDDIFASKTWAEWKTVFDTYDIQYLPVAAPEETLKDPQLHENAMLVDLPSGRFNAAQTVSSPLQVEGVSKLTPRPAPEIGQDSRDVLAEAGFDADEIAAILGAS
ncbi:MAG: CaiB/BaiF CoA transferase family protein [Pseudomonadales bacterium]